MKHIILCLLMVWMTPVSWGADFAKGLSAYTNGDYEIALREWTPLAERGDAKAQYNLGVMYENGEGVSQHYKTAAKWYRASAEQDFPPAANALGELYLWGAGMGEPGGILIDLASALKWITIAAETGHTQQLREIWDLCI